jgi:hypothetical protein
MARRLEIVAACLSAGLLVWTGVLGTLRLVDPSRNFFHRDEYEEAVAIAPFLEEARHAIPKDARTLVVTSIVLTPDIEYWFGYKGNCHWLQVVDRDRFVRFVEKGKEVPPAPAIEHYYEELDRLLTPERLAKKRKGFGWLVCTDAQAARRLLEVDPSMNAKIRLRSPVGLVVRLED